MSSPIVALVTGSGKKRVGWYVADALAERGYALAIHYRTSAADVRMHFEINALGTFLCSQHAGLAMVASPDGGLIVNVGDWAEVRPYLDYAAYFPSKGAVTAMTRSFAVELASRNPKV